MLRILRPIAMLSVTCFAAAEISFAQADAFTGSIEKLAAEDQKVAKDAVSRVALVQTLASGGLCAGSLVARDLVLTAWHCVDKVRRTRISFHGSRQDYDARVVAYDDAHDVAVLKLDRAPPLEPLKLRDEALPEGTPLVTIGHPLGQLYNVTAGRVVETGERFFLFNAAVNRGNSGGPVLDREGRVVGVAIILNQLIGGRSLGDAAALTPVRGVMAKAEASSEVSWRASRGSGYFDLGYGRDTLLNKLSGTSGEHFTYAIGWDYYDRWRVVFRHFTMRPDRVWGLETGPVFKELWGNPALLVGRNYYSANGKDVAATKFGIGFEFLFFDVTLLQVMEGDRNFTSFTIGF